MRGLKLFAIAPTICLLALTPAAQPAPVAPTKTEIAPGIFLFSRPGYGDVGLDGNSIVVTCDGVLVFDTNGTPSASAAVLAEIRAITTQPVKWIVNSHWHWDHWYGTETYQQAFPAVRVVSQARSPASYGAASGARVPRAPPVARTTPASSWCAGLPPVSETWTTLVMPPLDADEARDTR